jgi:WD40 repeat protein
MSFTAVLERLQKLENPYPGLRPFEIEEQHLFFGRDEQIAELVRRLECNRFVAVVGVSGGGKSSLVRAGLIPALERGSVGEAAARWRRVVSRPGGAPFANLADALSKAGLDASGLRSSSLGLVQVARQLPREETLLVVVDQFEELFRYKDCEPFTEQSSRSREEASSEAAEFVQLLLAASRQQPPIYLVLTMRSEYLGDCAEFRDLPETLNNCQYLVPRLTRDQRKQAIEGPLGRTAIAPSLVQRILNDAGDEPDQLPVLQHALMRTWRQWQESDPKGERGIQLQDYEAPPIGGMKHALERHAEELLGKDPEQIAIAQTVFKRLTAGTRRERRNPARLGELWELCGAESEQQRALVNTVIDRFRKGEATFLTPREGDLAPEQYIDITHESLIREWGRLRGWVEDETEARKTFMRIYEDARLYEAGDADLWRDPKLQLTLEWWREKQPVPAWVRHILGRESSGEQGVKTARDFLEKSKQARQEELNRARRRRLFARWGTTAVIAVLTGLIVWGWRNRAKMQAEHRLAVARALMWESSDKLRHNPDQLIPATLEAAESVKREATPASLQLLQLGTRLLRKPSAHFQPKGSLWGMAFSHDGRYLATASEEKITGVYDQHGNLVRELNGEGALWSVDFSPNGDYLATSGQNGVHVFKTGSWQPVWQTQPWQPILSVAFSPDGKQLATAPAWGNVTVLNAAAGNQVWQAENVGRAVAFSPQGRYLAMGGDLNSGRELTILDARSHGVLWKKDEKELKAAVISVSFSPDERYVAIGSQDKKAHVYDVQLKNEVIPLRHQDTVASVAFSPDGRYLATGSYDGAVRVFDFPDGREILRQPEADTNPAVSVAFSGDGTLAGASRDRGVDVITVKPADEIARLHMPKVFDAQQVGLSWDGKVFAVIDEGGNAGVFDPENGKWISAPVSLPEATQVAVSTGGRYLALGGKTGAEVVEASTGKVRLSLLGLVTAKGIDLTPDGRYFAMATTDGLEVYDVPRGKPAWSKNLKGSNVSKVSFSQDGERLAVGGEMPELEVLRVARGEQILRVPFHWNEEICKSIRRPCELNSIFLSKDGKFAVLAANDDTVRVIDVSQAREICLLTLPGNAVYAVMSDDDRFVATSSDDLLGRVYEVKNSQELWRMPLSTGDFFPLAFHDKYLLLGTGSHDLSLERYLWRPEDLMQSACAVLGRNLEAREWPTLFEETRPRTCSNLP